MRNHPVNSPQAAARILALALLADGHLGKSEIDVLDRLNAHGQLGLSRSDLHAVIHGFCEDLLASGGLSWADACRVDPGTLASLLDEITDPALRLRVLQLCVQVVEADRHVSEDEAWLLVTAVEQWNLQRAMLRPQEAAMA